MDSEAFEEVVWQEFAENSPSEDLKATKEMGQRGQSNVLCNNDGKKVSQSEGNSPPEDFQAFKCYGRWKNLWHPWQRPGLRNLLQWCLAEDKSSIPWNDEKELQNQLPLFTPEEHKDNYAKIKEAGPDGIQVMWIGHATVLVRFDGLTVLTDPVFANRCGPSFVTEWLGFGTKRYRRAPCSTDDLPEIHAVIISHDHYDHLCKQTVHDLHRKYQDKVTWFVPMDLKSWFTAIGCQNVEELRWWQEKELEVKGKIFKFISTPCQHWCMRGPTDENKALWCSWVIKGPRHSFFFAGDTGYYERLFKYIGEKFGPFSFAAIPIGAYEPRWMMKYQHVNPKEAVKIHSDVKAKYSVGIHWGTFYQTNEHYLAPRDELATQMKKQLPEHKESFITLNHGEVKLFENCHTEMLHIAGAENDSITHGHSIPANQQRSKGIHPADGHSIPANQQRSKGIHPAESFAS